MMSTYWYISILERKQLWSLLFVQGVPFILSLYFIDHIAPDDECGRTLKNNDTYMATYLFVPEICTWERVIWFQINRFLMFSILFSVIFVQGNYEISIRYFTFVYFTTTGLVWNTYRAYKRNSIHQRDVPFLLMLLANVLYLEIQPFCDENLTRQQVLMRMKNDKQRNLRQEEERRCWNTVIDQIRTSDDDSNIRSIIKEVEQKVAQLDHLYPCEPLPALPSTSRHVNETQAFVIFIIVHVLYFGLFIISAWSYVFLIGLLFGMHLE